MTTIRMLRLIGIASVAMSVDACTHVGRESPTGGGRIDAVLLPLGAARSDRLVAADLAPVHGATAADAVRQLRPEFLRGAPEGSGAALRRAMPSVYVDGRFAGELNMLDLIPIRAVLEIRRLDPVTAKSSFGSYCACDGGVIFVRLRP